MTTNSFIACLDVGTTTLRCIIFNAQNEIIGSARSSVNLIYPNPGFVEIDPHELWEQVICLIKEAISDANLTPKDIKCLGISTQRSTFSTWYRDNGEPIHNFITWKDLRAKDLCKELNTSFLLNAVRMGSWFIYLFTMGDRYLTGSKLKIGPNHVTGRLLWAMKNIPELKTALNDKNVMFGTIDTWLIYKFSKGSLHVTDVSNAAGTGFFDPFLSEWGSWAKSILGIPEEILPQVVANDFDFGSTDKSIFGSSIPIRCVMGDQSSSMFASGCFEHDDIKITLGTGAFLNVNTGTRIHTSVTGIYPLIGWILNNQIMYMGEVPCNDCGSLIEWLLKTGLVKQPSEIDNMVTCVNDSDGVYFIPAFSGLGPPINDDRASSGFLGIKATTTNNHLVRSVMEGIVYRLFLAYQTLKKEQKRTYEKITVDGGVSQNNFICQLLADMTELTVERLKSAEMSALGVGYVAGLATGVWKSRAELKSFNTVDKFFKPQTDEDYRNKCLTEFNTWLKVVERFKLWYKET